MSTPSLSESGGIGSVLLWLSLLLLCLALLRVLWASMSGLCLPLRSLNLSPSASRITSSKYPYSLWIHTCWLSRHSWIGLAGSGWCRIDVPLYPGMTSPATLRRNGFLGRPRLSLKSTRYSLGTSAVARKWAFVVGRKLSLMSPLLARQCQVDSRVRLLQCYHPLDPGTSPPRSTEMLATWMSRWR
jgi:hypothetical protein